MINCNDIIIINDDEMIMINEIIIDYWSINIINY